MALHLSAAETKESQDSHSNLSVVSTGISPRFSLSAMTSNGSGAVYKVQINTSVSKPSVHPPLVTNSNCMAATCYTLGDRSGFLAPKPEGNTDEHVPAMQTDVTSESLVGNPGIATTVLKISEDVGKPEAQMLGRIASSAASATSMKLDTSCSTIESTNAAASPCLEPTSGPTSAPTIDLHINNVVSTFSVRCHINLRLLASKAHNVEFKPSQGMVNLRLRYPYTTASIWSSGKITVTGATSEALAKLAARRYARILQKCGFKARFSAFRVVNVLGTCSLPFGISLPSFATSNPLATEYEPELHPGATYRIKKDMGDPATLKVFSTGSLTITAPCVSNVERAVEFIFPIVSAHQTVKAASALELDRQRNLRLQGIPKEGKKADVINRKRNSRVPISRWDENYFEMEEEEDEDDDSFINDDEMEDEEGADSDEDEEGISSGPNSDDDNEIFGSDESN